MSAPFYPSVEALRVSYSSLNGLYSNCNRKWEFMKLFQHEKSVDENVPGEVGKALHAGYQDFLINKDREKAITAMMLDYPIHLCADPGDFRSIEAAYATTNVMIDSGAFLEYEIASVKCPDGQTRKAIEVPFGIDIKNLYLGENSTQIPITYVGFIDAILYDKILDEYLVIDIKTTRDNLVDKTPVYQYDEQCIPYALVLERVLGREIHTLRCKYFSVFVDLQKAYCKVYSYERSKQDIEDWARGLYVKLHDIKRYFNMGWFPRNANNCVNFKRTCQFLDICHNRDHEAIQNYLLIPGKQPFVPEPIDYWIKLELELAA